MACCGCFRPVVDHDDQGVDTCACGRRLHRWCRPSCRPTCAVCMRCEDAKGNSAVPCDACGTPFHVDCCSRQPSQRDLTPCAGCGGWRRHPFVSKTCDGATKGPWCGTYVRKVCPTCSTGPPTRGRRRCETCGVSCDRVMFEAADGPRPTCAACRRAWDPIPVVTLLARHVLKGPIAMVVRETTVGSAVHELAQRGAMDGETGGGPPLRVPLAAPGARAWRDQ